MQQTLDAPARGNPEVTLATETIHNPAEPRHFMRIKPVARRVTVRHGGDIIAETTEAVRVIEAGKDLYAPALYLPRAALADRFAASDRSTHCPLKGDAGYLHLLEPGGAVAERDLAWSYDSPFDFADELRGRVSFYTDRVSIVEAPL